MVTSKKLSRFKLIVRREGWMLVGLFAIEPNFVEPTDQCIGQAMTS
jgi:hypothetical protein